MPQKNVDYELLLTDQFKENPTWTALTDSMGAVFNPVIQNPIEALAAIRSITTEPYFASLNMQTLGFRVPFLAFTPAEYQRLMKYIGIFVQTRGASIKFIDFIGFIKNVQFEHIPLWANDIDDINSLSDVFGTPIWQSGDWFPTPYYDVTYDIDTFTVDEAQTKYLFQVLAPIHLVIRYIIGVWRSDTTMFFTPYSFESVHDFDRVGIPLPDSILDDTFVLDSSILG